VDCGWQSPGQAANNRSERLTSLESKPNRDGRAAPLQTSDMRDFLCPFAMMISSQLAPDVLTRLKPILRPGRDSDLSGPRKVALSVSSRLGAPGRLNLLKTPSREVEVLNANVSMPKSLLVHAFFGDPHKRRIQLQDREAPTSKPLGHHGPR